MFVIMRIIYKQVNVSLSNKRTASLRQVWCIHSETLYSSRQAQVASAQSKQEVCYIYTKNPTNPFSVDSGIIRD